MIKVNFKEIDISPNSELSIYSSLTRIPFCLTVNGDLKPSNTIYSRNLCGGNFVELRFYENTRQLYEITLVSTQIDTVKIVTYDITSLDEKLYSCSIDPESELETSDSINIIKGTDYLSLVWMNNTYKYYSITNNCVIGTDSDGYLSSITLKYLSEDELYQIFGF